MIHTSNILMNGCLLNRTRTNLDVFKQQNPLLEIFIYLAKAFDHVNYNFLIRILERYGVCFNPKPLIMSCLEKYK